MAEVHGTGVILGQNVVCQSNRDKHGMTARSIVDFFWQVDSSQGGSGITMLDLLTNATISLSDLGS